MTADMRHMDHVERVALEDVRELVRKEETYRGSWKRRGGVGAFMMLARKWDRLESMLGTETWKYDVFGMIAHDGMDGHDGSALAEIRDLRRYLLLVEAEMVARSVVAERTADPPFGEMVRDEHGPCAPGAAEQKQVNPDGSDYHLLAIDRRHYDAVAARRFREALEAPGIPSPATLDWTGKKFRGTTDPSLNCEPAHPAHDWRNQRRRVEDGLVAGDAEDAWWPMIQVPGTAFLNANRAAMSREECEHLRRLHVEQNAKEWSELPAEYQGMYEWRESDLKWILCPEYREHWSMQP